MPFDPATGSLQHADEPAQGLRRRQTRHPAPATRYGPPGFRSSLYPYLPTRIHRRRRSPTPDDPSGRASWRRLDCARCVAGPARPCAAAFAYRRRRSRTASTDAVVQIGVTRVPRAVDWTPTWVGAFRSRSKRAPRVQAIADAPDRLGRSAEIRSGIVSSVSKLVAVCVAFIGGSYRRPRGRTTVD